MVRVIMAVLMALGILAAVWWLPEWGFDALVLVAAFLGFLEFGKMFIADPFERWATIIAGMLASSTMLFSPGGADAVVMTLAVLFFALSLVLMWRAKELPGSAERLGIALLGVLYLGLCFPFWGWLRAMHWGRELVLLAIVPACLCDTFALFAGKAFGRRKFAPMVSPNKTMEGFAGALAGSLAGTFFVKWIAMPQLSWQMAILFSIMIWIVSPFGDLIESFLKRSCGVKDSGNLIPGHGGILDRLDALIFTGPAAYMFARFVMKI